MGFRNILRGILSVQVLALLLCSCTDDGLYTLTNGKLSVSFDRADGSLVSLRNAVSGTELLDSPVTGGSLWRLLASDAVGRDSVALSASDAVRFSATKIGGRRISLRWIISDSISVTAHVRLDRNAPMSYWSADVSGAGVGSYVALQYPVMGGIVRKGNDKLAAGTWQGELFDNPEGEFNWTNPGKLGLQLLALYGDDGDGLYFSSNDTESRTKEYEMNFSDGHASYDLKHIIPLAEPTSEFSPGYEAVVGLFKGDWTDAAGIYREWAVKQKWCAESRLANGLVPDWARDTDVWVWNRGSASNVLAEAADLSGFLGDSVRVSVLWHWWHNCPYDDGFPEYLPPRDGYEAFRDGIASARAKNIGCLVYMNSYQWGNETESWDREKASQYRAITAGGSDYSWTYNKFTGHSITPMCLGTEYWRRKYSSIADTLVNQFGAGGIYMDQACKSLRCYDPAHGHSLGGGDFWVKGFFEMAEDIRRGADGPVVLAGEGTSESWMPYLDLFLSLEGSRERYKSGQGIETIPMFQAVYHDYAITFGSYDSLVYPPYDDKWPAEYRPDNCETLLPEEFNTQFRLEQARGFVWGLQPMIANYHSFLRTSRRQELDFLSEIIKVRARCPEYLVEGRYSRPPRIASAELEFPVSRMSIYAGRFGSTVTRNDTTAPALHSGGWTSREGNYAVAVANISDEAQPVRFPFDPERYGIEGRYRVNVERGAGRELLVDDVSGSTDVSVEIPGRGVAVIEFVKLQNNK